MAEIILEPTALSKVIPLSLKTNEVDSSLVGQLITNSQFNTADTDAWFSFTLDGLAATTGTFDLTLINLNDKSVFNHTDKVFNTNPFYYKLDSGANELTNEIRHAGKWVGQLVVTLPNGDSATRKFIFSIEGHILDGTVVKTILLEDYNTLIAGIEASKDALTQYNIDYAALIETVTDQEAARVQAELTRAQTFDALVESEMIAQNVATKLTEKEATYAPRLLSAEQQLADIELKKADQSDLLVEKARIDSFTTLASGSTTGDAELIDGRVGADGITYPNIGGAVRSQIDYLSDNLINGEITNYPLAEKATQQYLYTLSGGLLSQNTSTAWRSTDYIDVKKVIKFKSFVDVSATKPYIMYFSDKTLTSFISGFTIEVTPFNGEYEGIPTPPEGANYCIIQCLNSKVALAYVILDERQSKLIDYVAKVDLDAVSGYVNVQNYASLATDGIWTEAIQAALDTKQTVYLPYQVAPYNINDRLIVYSGQTIIADKNAVIYLMDGTGTCFLRNENMFSDTPDHDITIKGGIWDGNYLNNDDDYGNGGYCASDKVSPVRGVSGMFSIMGVKKLEIAHVTIKQCRSFGMHITNCSDFHIHDIYFDDNKRDGIHVTGNAKDFRINDIHGLTKDDLVALNAWDWSYSTARFGNIVDGVIENLHMDVGSDNAIPTGDFIRFLCGEELGINYTVDNIVVKNVFGNVNYNGFLISHEEDLENPAHVAQNGKIGNLYFENVFCGSNTLHMFRVAVDVDSITIKNAKPTKTTPFVTIESNFTVKKMSVDGYYYDGASDRGAGISVKGRVEKLNIRDAYYRVAVKNTVFTGFINMSVGASIVKGVINDSKFEKCGTIINANADIIGLSFTFDRVSHFDSVYSIISKLGSVKLINSDFDTIGNIVRNVGTGSIPVKELLCEKTATANSVGTVDWTVIS